MKRPAVGMILVACVAGIWFFWQYFEVLGLEGLRIRPRATAEGRTADAPTATAPRARTVAKFASASSSRPLLRVAAWDLDHLQVHSGLDPEIEQLFARTLRQFDLLALQGLSSVPRGVMERLVDLASSSDAKFIYVPPPTRDGQLAWIYNSQTLVLDPEAVYTVLDPDQLLTQDPLVGWFRARGPDPRLAFTFTVINYYVEPQYRDRELETLEQTLFQVRGDGRREDDVILCGNLQASHEVLAKRLRSPHLTWLVAGDATDIRLQGQTANLVIDRAATVEQSGGSGVFDFLREYNLSVEQAARLSPFLPVWSEFQFIEGALPGVGPVTPSG